jgi:creatinine amidohydrolase
MKQSVMLPILFFFVSVLQAQELPFKLEELTAPEFIEAVEKSAKTIILPIGVFEKHGAHLPLGTDLYIAREMALRAAEQEYTVVFPSYYFSQINEARHQPGTISYSPELIWKVLQETLNELSRNGFKKIIIVNGHGGNNAFLNYFGMAQLSERRDYALYLFQPSYPQDILRQVEALTIHDQYDQHGGNRETSTAKAIVPHLVHTDRATQQSGVDLNRLNNLPNIYSGIWWYARYPNHYSGDGSKASAEAGELLLNAIVEQLIKSIRDIKADTNVPALQKQFFDEAENPLKTKQ